MKKWLILIASFLLVFAVSVSVSEKAVNPGSLDVGVIVTFGSYEQDGNADNGAEPIEWTVLDVQEGKALLLSVYGLEMKPYHSEKADVTWENCSLRSWLNDEFVPLAFSKTEIAAILPTEVDNSLAQCNELWTTDGGNNTTDLVFLLSFAEAGRYLNISWKDTQDEGARVLPTLSALQNGANITDVFRYYYDTKRDKHGWWWLRSPGKVQSRALVVDVNGSFLVSGVNDKVGCVRPAIWLNLAFLDESGELSALLGLLGPNQEEGEYRETGWELPEGAEVIRQWEEIHHYDHVLDHYDSVEVQKTRKVLDHYETDYEWQDLGNGTFEQVAVERPVYVEEIYTETIQQPVYIEVPRYATKYEYIIRK